MSEEKGFLRHPIVVAVIAGLTVPAGLAVASYEGVTVENTAAWLKRLARFWGADVTLPRWSFWLWATGSLLAVLLLALRIYFVSTEDAAPVQPAKRKTAAAHQAYTTDVFFSFRWRWKTAMSGEIWDISMYCPKCDQQLVNSDFATYQFREFRCQCSNCRYTAPIDGASPLDMHKRVKLEAERRIRTGEWKRAKSLA